MVNSVLNVVLDAYIGHRIRRKDHGCGGHPIDNTMANHVQTVMFGLGDPQNHSEGGGGSLCQFLPKFFSAIEKISKNPNLNERGWAQLDKDLTNQLMMRASSLIAPSQKSDPHGASGFGPGFGQYKINSGGGWGKCRRY